MAAKEITKEDCRQLYNLYAQVETSESIIKDLEEFVKSQGEKVPDIIPKSYQTHVSIEINIPYFEHGKFADNVGPKFHVGEWVVFNTGKGVYKVEKIENYEYTLRYILGGSMCLPFSNEELIRKWTIQDAKDGDVLATSAGAFIYNGNNGGGSCPGSYCGINTLGSFQTGVEHHWTGKKVYPATKEQRDLLFSKMKEAGYEWNANKKELKKIEDEKKQDITERIKTFEDAYNELGDEHPFVRAFNGYVSHIHERDMNDYDLITYLKLRIITAALNEGWEPQFVKGEERWCFWYDLITQKEYDNLSAKDKSRVVYRGSSSAYAYGGVSCANAFYDALNSYTNVGSRLSFKNKKLAEYAGRQFAEIYADFCFKPKSEEKKG